MQNGSVRFLAETCPSSSAWCLLAKRLAWVVTIGMDAPSYHVASSQSHSLDSASNDVWLLVTIEAIQNKWFRGPFRNKLHNLAFAMFRLETWQIHSAPSRQCKVYFFHFARKLLVSKYQIKNHLFARMFHLWLLFMRFHQNTLSKHFTFLQWIFVTIHCFVLSLANLYY